MREFIFRAWDKKNRRMINPPGPCDSSMGPQMTMDGRFYLPVKDDSIPAPMVGWQYMDWQLMQWTGLIDKDAEYIYEGDILGGILEGGCILYCEQCKSLQYHACNECYACSGEIHWYELAEDDGKLEVIGNIYENPELLV